MDTKDAPSWNPPAELAAKLHQTASANIATALDALLVQDTRALQVIAEISVPLQLGQDHPLVTTAKRFRDKDISRDDAAAAFALYSEKINRAAAQRRGKIDTADQPFGTQFDLLIDLGMAVNSFITSAAQLEKIENLPNNPAANIGTTKAWSKS